ncbi:MAG TPA: hypothetical protein DDZ53_04475 [Firmicutes bacterium]|nr:hypothetical protein [Bacillota bacterium]
MRSIRGKLWLGMMTLVGVVLALLWLLQIVFLEDFYTNLRISDVKRRVNSIAQVEEGNAQSIIDELDRLAYTHGLTLEWVDATGQSVYLSAADSARQIPQLRNVAWRELYQRVLSGNSVEMSFVHHRFGNKYTVIGVPVYGATGDLAGGIIATVPMAAVSETADILKRQLGYITVALLVVTGLLSLWLSRSFTKPVLHIRQVAVAMANGDFSARASVKSADEIGMLANAINYLGEQLAKIEQLRRDLVANVSHELRTPLSVIRGYAETIRDITGDEPEQREVQLEIIIEETERLADMVNDTLQLALLQSGNVHLDLREVVVSELLEDAVKQYEIMAEQSNIGLTLEGALEVIVIADEAKIVQVMHNLLQNSLHYTGATGQIAVRANVIGQSVRISVSDTGLGIAESDLPHVWDKYYKGKRAGSNEHVGTGLGLAIVKGILEAHNAKYGVDSQLGEGTTVWFELRKACSQS